MIRMGRIPGYYEWDDDSLTPGQKMEGGLHQNLFDDEGKLKGSARFVPADEDVSDPLVVTETVYIPVEERRKSKEEENVAVSMLLSILVLVGAEIAKPHVQHWWRESFQPFVGKQWLRLRKRPAQSVGSVPSVETAQESTSEVSTDLVLQDTERPRMSSAEAQARLLTAIAAQSFADDQMRLVNSAEIVGEIDADSVREAISKLPPKIVAELVKRMEMNPTILGDDSLAELVSVLARQANGSNRQLNAQPFDEDSS